MKKHIITTSLLLAAFVFLPKNAFTQDYPVIQNPAPRIMDDYITRKVTESIVKGTIESNHPKGKGKAVTREKPNALTAELEFVEDWNHLIGRDKVFVAIFKFVPLDASKKLFTRTYKFTEETRTRARSAPFTDIPAGDFTVTGEITFDGQTKPHRIYFSKEKINTLYHDEDDRVFTPSFELHVGMGKDYYGTPAMLPDVEDVWITAK